MSKTLSIAELRKFLKDQPLNYIRLIDQGGNTLVPFNKIKKNITENVKEIERVLGSTLHPDGLYFLSYKSTIQGQDNTIAISKGVGTISEGAKPTIVAPPIKEDASQNVLSYKEALAMQTRIAELELKLQAREEEDEEDEDEDLAEPAPDNTLNDILKECLPKFLDKYFENEDRKIKALEEGRRSAAAGSSAAVAVQRASGTYTEEEQKYITYLKNSTPEQLKKDLRTIYDKDQAEALQMAKNLLIVRPHDAQEIIDQA